MASIEKKIITALLTLIRKQRTAPIPADGGSGGDSSSALPAVKLREARFSDFVAVAELKRRWGLAPDSTENWERLWHRNPALRQMNRDLPIGWVLESENQLVGYLGNISLLYHFGGETLLAVAGSGLVVEPAYRAASITLIAAYYRQKSVDLYLTTTAVEAVGKIARIFKSDPLPQPEYETVLFWVLQSYPFAQAVMKQLELNSMVSYVGSLLTSLAVKVDNVIQQRSPRQPSKDFKISEIGIKEIGDDFQTLWLEKLGEKWRLLADRSHATLAWHYDIPGDGASTRVLCCHVNGKLEGYAVVRSDLNPRNGLRRAMVADMLASQDNPKILRALLAAIYDYARRSGSQVLEVMGFPSEIRQVLLESKPYLRKYPACPFYYKAANPILHKALADPMAWYASPFDGDTTLVPSRAGGASPLAGGSVQTEDPASHIAPEIPERERTGAL
jgi:hypothetical protein